MSVRRRVIFALAVVLLAAAYYWLGIMLVGYALASPRPDWWVPAFPSRLSPAITWLQILHTLAVMLAALPIAFAAHFIFGRHAVLLGATAAFLSTAISAYPMFDEAIWPLIMSGRPIIHLVDTLKFLLAIPLLVLVIRKLPSNYAL